MMCLTKKKEKKRKWDYHVKKKRKNNNMPSNKQKEFSDKLNDFYCRFDTQDFETELARLRPELQAKLGEDVDLDHSDIDARLLKAFFAG